MKKLYLPALIVILHFLTGCIQASSPQPVIDTPTKSIIPSSIPPATHAPSALQPTSDPSISKPTSDLSFTQGNQFMGNDVSFSVKTSDIDLDGDTDILIANYNSPSVLWLNNGEGQFTQSSDSLAGPGTIGAHDTAIDDFNGDGYPDIFLLYHKSPSKVLLNNGSAGFNDNGQNIGDSDDNPQWVVTGDPDNDGDIDVFIIFSRQPNRLWLNDGTGTFTLSNESFGGTTSNEMLLADFNADEALDILYCYIDRPGEVWLNDGQGSFTNTSQSIPVCSEAESGDVDGDGDTDIVIATIETGISIWLNEGETGSFSEAVPYFYPGTLKFKLFDADGDGDLDIIASNIDKGNGLLINEGSASFTDFGPILGPAWAHALTTGKLDRDSSIDIIIGYDNAGGGLTLFFNQ